MTPLEASSTGMTVSDEGAEVAVVPGPGRRATQDAAGTQNRPLAKKKSLGSTAQLGWAQPWTLSSWREQFWRCPLGEDERGTASATCCVVVVPGPGRRATQTRRARNPTKKSADRTTGVGATWDAAL